MLDGFLVEAPYRELSDTHILIRYAPPLFPEREAPLFPDTRLPGLQRGNGIDLDCSMKLNLCEALKEGKAHKRKNQVRFVIALDAFHLVRGEHTRYLIPGGEMLRDIPIIAIRFNGLRVLPHEGIVEPYRIAFDENTLGGPIWFFRKPDPRIWFLYRRC